MRLRSISVALLLVVFAALTVRETRCGSECQAAAALFAANARSVQQAEAMPGMEDCPMAKAHGDGFSASITCRQSMVHAPESAQTKETVSAPEFSFAAVALAQTLTQPADPLPGTQSSTSERAPPGRPPALVSLQSTLRI